MIVFLLISGVLIGGLIPFWSKMTEKIFRYALTFSASYLLCAILVHLLPELFDEANHEGLSAVTVGFFLLFGFFIQKLLENFSGGVEHGHIHHHRSFSPVGLLIALCVHAFLEGAVLADTGHEHHHVDHLLFGLLLHKAPAAFALSSILMESKVDKRKALLFLFLFALASPFGLWCTSFALIRLDEIYSTYILAIVSGNLLHIATTIFYESSPEHKLHWNKWLATILGVGVALLVEFL